MSAFKISQLMEEGFIDFISLLVLVDLSSNGSAQLLQRLHLVDNDSVERLGPMVMLLVTLNAVVVLRVAVRQFVAVEVHIISAT